MGIELCDSQERYIPLPVRRMLRQEACFGCAKCGSPILEYHHIVPWAEIHHNDPSHMVALCPTHHRQFGKLERRRSYEVKANPRNKSVNKLYGELGTDKKITVFKVGSNIYEETPVVFSYFEQPIISYTVEDHQALLDIYIPRSDMWPDVLIKRNDMIVNSDDLWDVEFSTNYLKIQKKSRENFFELDLRQEVGLISGAFSIGGSEFRFSPTSTNIDGASISNSYFVRCTAGISYGDGKRRLHWPNYAMLKPRAVFSRIL